MKLLTTIFLMLYLSSTPLYALSLPPVPTEPVYYEPPVVQVADDIRLKSCIQIDSEIRYLQPYRYSYKAKFNDDPYNAIAVSSVAFDVSLGGILPASFLAYSALVEEKEQRRMLLVEQQIAMLQNVKAEKHCFE